MLEIKNLNKTFGRFSIKNINLTVASDDYFILLGPSGAGKSLLLEIIAGLTKADSGTIKLNGADITGKAIDKRKTGLIFQHPAIFPHLSVKDNIMFPMIGSSRNTRKAKSLILAEQMGITHLLDSRTAKLSGGEMQRVALARVLASDPLILLLDEPLSAVDTALKTGLRGLLRNLNQNGLPILHVTHDYEEAISLSTSMAVIEDGVIIQKGTPEAIFNKPASSFAAAFSGEHNFFKVHIKDHIIFPQGYDNIRIFGPEEIQDGIAHIMIRSRNIIISNEKPDLSTMNNLQGIVQSINPLRDGFEVMIDCGINIFAKITRESVERLSLHPGKSVWACFKASSVEIIR